MGIYDMWKKKKLEELDKTKRLSILNELDVGYRKMQHASLALIVFGFAALGFLFVAMGIDVAVGISIGAAIVLVSAAIVFFAIGFILMMAEAAQVEAEMQKELEAK